MLRFLKDSKAAVSRQFAGGGRVHAVFGNESCDLDSAAASLTYAYLLSSMDRETLFVPVLNIPEQEYPLKTEVTFFLHKLGIGKEHLVFRPELDLAALHRAGRLLITLVDRHRLDGPDAPLQPCVVHVLDHHQPDRPLSDDVVIEPVGSCCTLVAERLFQLNRSLIDRTVADLLLGTIVLDTVNMSAAAQRGTPKDRLMISFLEPLSSGDSPDQLFEMLQRAKGDVSRLSSFELLSKDQKAAEGAALSAVVCSVPMLVKDFVRAPDAVSACNQLCQSTGRDLVVLLGSQTGAEFSRDLAVFSAKDEARNQVCAALEGAVTPCLGLSRVSSPHQRLTLFSQANVAASRKAVLPLLQAYLAALPAPAGSDSGELSPVGRPTPRRASPPPSAPPHPARPEVSADLRPPNGIDLALSAQVAALLEPTSTAGSSQSSAHSSVPYTPQNSVADSDAIADVTLPSFNSRELLQRIELRRGPLGGFEGADDIGAYPFTPKNSFVEEGSTLEATYRHMNMAELDSDAILQRVHEKKRNNELFDDIEEEEADVTGPAAGATGGTLVDSRAPNGVTRPGPQQRAGDRSEAGSRHSADTGRMRTERGTGSGTATLTQTGAAGDPTGSLNGDRAAPQSPGAGYRAAALSPVEDGSLYDDDTATFKSALSSSEAIRRRDSPAAMSAATDGSGDPVPPGSTNGTPPAASSDPARLWRAGDGRTVRDRLEHGLSGGGDSSGPRSVSFGELPPGHHGSPGGDAGGGPESLSQLSLTPLDDDYYEDFTLPGTHEGVMSRQKSFRRRVRDTPVSEPDADRIEHLVRAGELERHGSIRRKLVAPAASLGDSGSPGRFGHDLREIEQLMEEEGEQVAIDDLPSLGPVLGASTPKTPGEPTDQPASLPPFSDEPLSIEMSSTIMKVRECLDQEKLKDIYTISGRLQDILTQEDIQEILDHPEMFAQLLGEGILAELRSSMSESQHGSPSRPAAAAAVTTDGPSSGSASPASARHTITVQAEVSAEQAEDSSSPSISPSPSFAENRSASVVDVSAAAAQSADAVSPVPSEATEVASPAPSPRSRILPPAELTSDHELTAPSDRCGPSSLPAEPPSRADAASPPPGPLWRSGSLRRIGGHRPLEALFAESDARPVAGQRRIVAPTISLDDSETPERDGTFEEPVGKPADADSGVSETGTADWLASRENLEASRENLEASRENLEASRENLEASRENLEASRENLEASRENLEASRENLGPEDDAETPSTPKPHSRPRPSPDRPSTLSGAPRRKKISVSADVLADQDTMSGSSQLESEDDGAATPTEALATSELLDTLTPDDIETPDELEASILERLPPAEPIPEYTAREEINDERAWRSCVVAGLERRIDMKVIEPYKKVLSHGGYLGLEGDQAIIVFSACYLPDRSRRDYSYVMDNLFLYVLTTLDSLIAEDYILIYLHGATQRSCMPSFGWLKRCYQMVDRRLRKNLKGLYLVHPTFWVKTIVALTRPFISSKFSRKLRFVASLMELSQLLPMDHVCIPDRVKQYDEIKASLQTRLPADDR
ncbi:uncharacterized protein LOC122391398 isoform X2 [Amphibalanus amphitrite]|uniref:uncharacterized protein LOC122391398 isoform X2 n=1 Tax=Amphibalanus amphitrite TaxID=1232801 RepID=UPI001C909C4F|nr:uncharacterized protein LOC122391398 isoform X2 [Amphibalanus amphitrite]